MAKEKRTRPCLNCKRSKVRCIYSSSLPCERCIKNGHSASCHFVPKLPLLKLPLMSQLTPSELSLPPFNAIPAPPGPAPLRQPPGPLPQPLPVPSYAVAPSHSMLPPVVDPPASSDHWKSRIDSKIDTFDSKLASLENILKGNQRLLVEQQRFHQHSPGAPQHFQNYGPPQLPYAPPYSRIEYPEQAPKRALPQEPAQPKRRKQLLPEDFRDGFLDVAQARALFLFFDSNISPQLFGFEISRFSVDTIWHSSPILICAICTIASMHHPDPELSSKLAHLQKYLHTSCGKLLFEGRPKTDMDGFNTIVALVLCSFWLLDSQMFTGLALQLAKEIELNKPISALRKSGLLERDRLKLWYLLYVLDGQQSLTFNRQRLVDSEEYSLKHSRAILLKRFPQLQSGDQRLLISEKEAPKEQEREEGFTDLRLVSQVEYNQALNAAFAGNAWEILAPSSFGIPSKSNLELDKWMVSWTVLLSPVNHGSVWSSKSTLIYYNFAKMHINSSAVRQLQIDAGDEKSKFPRLDPQEVRTLKIEHIDRDSEDDSDDEDEFISNKELITTDESVVSANIAVNAAQTVLNLVLSDNDILNNLKYVPVHIHIMLYYAALLLINPPLESNNTAEQYNADEHFRKIAGNLRVVKTLQRKIYLNLPTDKAFGNRLIKSLDEVVQEKAVSMKLEIEKSALDVVSRRFLVEQLNSVLEQHVSDNVVDVSVSPDSCLLASPGPEKIYAWPGSNHGHP